MDEKNIQSLLSQIKLISDHYKEMEDLSGESFNVFKVLKVERKEVKMHSAFIAELLKPKGSHKCGHIFLDLFIKQIGYSDFIACSAKVEAEKYINVISDNYEHGGNIDIIVVDKEKKAIIIENKIDAIDQKNQLLRYFNYGVNEFGELFNLYYLTLDGKEATNESLGLKPSEQPIGLDGKEATNESLGNSSKVKYIKISYKEHILLWLEECKEKAGNNSILKESIAQYINLVKWLTKQSSEDKCNYEVAKAIINNNLNAFLEIYPIKDLIINYVRLNIKESFPEESKSLFEDIVIDENNDNQYSEDEKKLIKIISGSIDNYTVFDRFFVHDMMQLVKTELVKKLFEQLEEIKNEENRILSVHYDDSFKFNEDDAEFYFKIKGWAEDFCVFFGFDGNFGNGFYYGIELDDNKNTNLISQERRKLVSEKLGKSYLDLDLYKLGNQLWNGDFNDEDGINYWNTKTPWMKIADGEMKEIIKRKIDYILKELNDVKF